MTYALAAAQTALVAALIAVSWSRERGWATAGVVAAGTWTLIFLIPSWVFAAEPTLVTVGSLNGALFTVDLSLLCFIIGYAGRLRVTSWYRGGLMPRRTRPPVPLLAVARPTDLDRRWLMVWLTLGVLGLGVLFLTTGGPIHFVENLSNEGAMTRGRTYFIFSAMALVWVPQTVLCARWINGREAGPRVLLAVALALALIATIGARELLVVPLLELALFYWIVRRRISGVAAAAACAAALFVIVFVLGMVKLYGNYQIQHPGSHISRLDFLVTRGPGDFARSYSVNTADGVLLIALGEHIVPSHAPPELGKEFLRLALHVIPSSFRPALHTASAIRAAIYPSTTNSYAQPLQLVAYLQFELPGVIVASLVLGAVAATIDRLLQSPQPYRFSSLMLLVALATAVSTLLRDADAAATAGSIVQVVGLWSVARTAERPGRSPLVQPFPH